MVQVKPVFNLDPSLSEQEKPLPLDRYGGLSRNFVFQRFDVVDCQQPAPTLSEVDLVDRDQDALKNVLRLDSLL